MRCLAKASRSVFCLLLTQGGPRSVWDTAPLPSPMREHPPGFFTPADLPEAAEQSMFSWRPIVAGEHGALCVLVHFGLESILTAQRRGPDRGGAGGDFID